MRDEKLRGDETGVVEIRIAETGVVVTKLPDGVVETRVDNNSRRLNQF